MALAATSIAALLSDLLGLASMATTARFVTLPAMVALAALGASRLSGSEELQRRLRVGAVAGLVGTLGYDLIRVPFSAIGMRLFAPIDSYGLMLADAGMASPWTNTLGWLFHLSNGVTFGVIYAVMAARRNWTLGLVWGLLLESVVLVTPFRTRYAMSGEAAVIAVSYFAHLAFGAPVGRMSERLDHWDAELRSTVRRPVVASLGVAVAALLLWQQPWSESGTRREAGRIAAAVGTPTVVVDADTFTPEWVRLPEDGCLHVVNRSASDFTTPHGAVEAGSAADWCFPRDGIHRVKLGARPYSGGFVMVEAG